MIICINRSHFEQFLGYGLWTLLTIGLFFLFSIPLTESFNSHIEQIQSRGDMVNAIVYVSSLDGDVNTFIDIEVVYLGWVLWSLPFIINLLVIGLWFYGKQNKFRIEFCEKTGVKKNV